MHSKVEVKYRKFPVVFGQRLSDTPAFVEWKEEGWYVTWRHRTIENGAVYIETLMKRQAQRQYLVKS